MLKHLLTLFTTGSDVTEKEEDVKKSGGSNDGKGEPPVGGVDQKILPYSVAVLNVYDNELDTFDGATGQSLLKYDVSNNVVLE